MQGLSEALEERNGLVGPLLFGEGSLEDAEQGAIADLVRQEEVERGLDLEDA